MQLQCKLWHSETGLMCTTGEMCNIIDDKLMYLPSGYILISKNQGCVCILCNDTMMPHGQQTQIYLNR